MPLRRWARSEDYPPRGWYAHLDGELWVDLSREKAGHNQLKTKFAVVLTPLVEQAASGTFFGDRMLLTHTEVGLSTEPDGMFVSHVAMDEGRAALEEGQESLEVQGTPDMVLEVISPTSRQKDTVVLRELYWRAGVREYWLAEPLREGVTFDILRYGSKGYTAVRRQQGDWLRSSVFERSFRLTRTIGPGGLPIYNLDVR